MNQETTMAVKMYRSVDRIDLDIKYVWEDLLDNGRYDPQPGKPKYEALSVRCGNCAEIEAEARVNEAALYPKPSKI
jgi:hypothetical protein